MANNPNKFRGARIQPVGAGKMQAQKPAPTSNSKREGALLAELERVKLEGDPLTLRGNSEEPNTIGAPPTSPTIESGAGDRLIFYQDTNPSEPDKVAIGIDTNGEMWFQDNLFAPDNPWVGGAFKWYFGTGLGSQAMRLQENPGQGVALLLVQPLTDSTTWRSTLDVAGSISLGFGEGVYTSSTTLDERAFNVICDATGGAFTLTLPAVADCRGRIYFIKKIDASANAVTIDGNGAQTIDGAATYVINAQYNAVTIVAGSSEWHVISQN